MSKLDDLIQEFCPNGIEYKKLLDVAEIVYGYACDARKFNNEKKGMPLVRIRDVSRGYTETYTTEDVPPSYYVQHGDFFWWEWMGILIRGIGLEILQFFVNVHVKSHQKMRKFMSKTDFYLIY